MVTVVQVVSGQTVEVVGYGGNSQPQKVRLIGLDAPDLKQTPWGEAAKARLMMLVMNQPVLLESDRQSQDAFGRVLGYLWLGQQLVNRQLVAEGYVLAVPRSPNLKYQELLMRAQETARLVGKGIWNPDRPLRQTPTEFRKQAEDATP